MKPESRSVLAVIVMALGAWTPNSRATVIDFDDVPIEWDGPIAPTRYRSVGVVLSTIPPGFDLGALTAFGWTPDTPPKYLATADSFWPIAVEFVLPGTTTPATTREASFYVVGPPGYPPYRWTASAYALGGGLLESVTGTTLDTFVEFSRPTAEIHKLVFGVQRGDIGLDTLTFGTIVPEPATLVLGGVIVLLATTRRHPRIGRKPGNQGQSRMA